MRALKNKGLLLSALIICSCESGEINKPKPSTYLRPEIPAAQEVLFDDNCPYRFNLSNLYTVASAKENPCNKDIDLGPLNGTMHFSYIEMDSSLSTYVNYANDKVDDHKIKATAILDSQFVAPDKRVFGTFFELQGNVASPFQFYLTDSSERFVSAVVYFNSVPNYDSLRPSLDYLKADLYQMISTFEWQN